MNASEIGRRKWEVALGFLSGFSQLLISSVVVLPCMWLAAAVPAVGQEHLTIAAYNVENMFDVFDDPYTDDQNTDVKQRWEIEAIASAIRDLEADVVAFSELENKGVLRAMNDEFLYDLDYDHVVVSPTNSDRGINLGVISRHPIDRVISYRFQNLTLDGDPRTWRFARDLMQVTIRITAEVSFELFVVHFKSKRASPDDPNSASWRLAEAVAVRRIIDGVLERFPDRPAAVVGDFNDTPDSPTLAALLDGGALVDVHTRLPADQRITFLHKPYKSTIDYILASPATASALVPGSARIMSEPGLLRGSDHAPVAATFMIGPPVAVAR